MQLWNPAGDSYLWENFKKISKVSVSLNSICLQPSEQQNTKVFGAEHFQKGLAYYCVLGCYFIVLHNSIHTVLDLARFEPIDLTLLFKCGSHWPILKFNFFYSWSYFLSVWNFLVLIRIILFWFLTPWLNIDTRPLLQFLRNEHRRVKHPQYLWFNLQEYSFKKKIGRFRKGL